MCIQNKNSVCKLAVLTFASCLCVINTSKISTTLYADFRDIFISRAYFFFKTSKYKEGFLTHYLDCILKIKLIFRRRFLLQFVKI